MSAPKEIPEPDLAQTPPPGKWLIAALALLAFTVIVHAILTDWRPSPGGNPWLVPVIAACLILLCALVLGLRLRLQSARHTVDLATRRRRVRDLSLTSLSTGLWGLGFFHAVQGLGIVTATTLFTAAGMLVLSPTPSRSLRIVLPLALTLGFAFWLLFTRLAPIVMQDPLLW
jgi:hypothetical protein